MEKLTNNPIFKKIFNKFGWNTFVILGLAGVILIALSEVLPAKANKTREKAVNTTEEYRMELETSLGDILASVNGVGKVKIMITLESDSENIYVQQEKSTDDTQSVSKDASVQESTRSTYENEVVMVTDGSAKSALVEKTLQPTVQGVIVVCQGADNISVISDVTNAVAVALDVPSSRICVIKMQ